MTYNAFEISNESGAPVELYTFTIGATVYRYTSAEDVITYSANQYLPRQIDRTSPPVSGTDVARRMMEVTLPTTDPVANRYIGIVPAERVELQVIRFHRTDSPNGAVIWDGRIVSAKFEQQGALCRLYSVSSESALSRPMPGRKYQGLCNHVLYDGFCQVVKANHKYTATVSVVNGGVLTIPGLLAAKGAGWAIGGTVDFIDDKRLIVAQDGDDISLQVAFRDNPLGVSVDVYAGCNHSSDATGGDCPNKFNNMINFGGFPFVPTKNPFNTGMD